MKKEKEAERDRKKSSADGSFGVAQSPKVSNGGTKLCYPDPPGLQEEFQKIPKMRDFFHSSKKAEETDGFYRPFVDK